MSLRARLAALLVTLRLRTREPMPVWTVDRDGRVRLPERQVILQAR